MREGMGTTWKSLGGRFSQTNAEAMLGYVVVGERWQGGAYSYGADRTLQEFGRELLTPAQWAFVRRWGHGLP